jgi:hypothetical protein
VSGRIRLTLIVTVTLSAAYFLYATGVRLMVRSDGRASPLQEARPPMATSSAPRRLMDENARMAGQHLADQTWASDAKIQLRNGSGLYYYSQDVREADSKRSLRFEPLALVWFMPDQAEPHVIIADSAVITFQNEVELNNPDPGRIVGGLFEGEVTIRGPEDLSLRGQHFTFSEKSHLIWSDHRVEFTWRQHSGEADQGIQVELEIDETLPHLAVKSIREVELRRRVRMNLHIDGDGEGGDPAVPGSIECSAGFRLTMTGPEPRPHDAMTGTFEGQVLFQKALAAEDGFRHADTLRCDRLELFLDRPDPDRIPGAPQPQALARTFGTGKTDNASEESGSPGGIHFRRLRASGRQVLLTSPANQMLARLESLSRTVPASLLYDLEGQTAVLNDLYPLSGRLDVRPGLPQVHLERAGSELHCPQVILNHDSQWQIREVMCRGAGTLAHRETRDPETPLDVGAMQLAGGGSDRPDRDAGTAASSPLVLTAAWSRMLRLYPDARSGEDVIDLTGDADVRFPEAGSAILAGTIKVWTDPVARLMKAADRSESDGPAPTPLPRRVLAVDRVQLSSPELHGQMQELQVWFERETPGSGSIKRLEPVSLRQPVRQTSATETGPGLLPTDVESAQEAKPPAKLSARLTRVRLVVPEEGQPQVSEVITEGDVVIEQPREAGQAPVILRGQQLHLQNRGATGQTVRILGQPAAILDPDMKLTGDDLYLDRQQNRLRVDGEGLMELPMDRDLDGRPLPEPTSLTITWNEQMTFDGQLATFAGRVNARVFNSVMRCQQLEVTMAEPVSFQETTGQRTQPRIATAVCRYQVEIESHEMEPAGLKELRKARFAAFGFDAASGRAEGRGPGYVAMWQRGQGKRAGLSPLGAVGANQGAKASSSAWEYTRIDFAREMVGHVSEGRRQMKFNGQVQVVYGPVEQPLEVVDLDHLPKDGGAMSCQTLQAELVPDTGGSAARRHMELRATGNARLEGQSFFAQAEEITFDESKGLYQLKSFGNQDSVLSREKVRFGERSEVVARTFRFIPSRNKVEFDDASQIRGLQ